VRVGDRDRADAAGADQAGRPGAARARAGHHHAHLRELALGRRRGVQERREDDDRGPVLVVVYDRDRELLVEAALDLKALRRAYVLEVDGREARRDRFHGGDELLDSIDIERDRYGVDSRERSEQQRLALEHR
jgi:hypothetical protein